MQISARWVFPVTSVSMFLKSRSVSQGSGDSPLSGDGIWLSAISSS